VKLNVIKKREGGLEGVLEITRKKLINRKNV